MYSSRFEGSMMTHRMPTVWPSSWANVLAVSSSVLLMDVMLGQEKIVNRLKVTVLTFSRIISAEVFVYQESPDWMDITPTSTAKACYAFYITSWLSWKFQIFPLIRFVQAPFDSKLKEVLLGCENWFQPNDYFHVAWKVANLLGWFWLEAVFHQGLHHLSTWLDADCNMLHTGNLKNNKW